MGKPQRADEEIKSLVRYLRIGLVATAGTSEACSDFSQQVWKTGFGESREKHHGTRVLSVLSGTQLCCMGQ